MAPPIPAQLAAACRHTPERHAWLARLPRVIEVVAQRWALELGPPYRDASCAWVAPARWNGRMVVFKIGMPHMEGAHEIQGLRFWNGNPTVQLLAADEAENAMLLERCQPGHSLRTLPEPEQDIIIASLLRRCWRPPGEAFAFRALAAQMASWEAETAALGARRWRDTSLVRHGLQLFEELSTPAPNDVVLATDLHAGNVLRAGREPWLVIDPKPFIGDRAYDATQHLLNCRGRLRTDALATIRRMSDLLEVDETRARLWLFARLAAEPRDAWDEEALALTRSLA